MLSMIRTLQPTSMCFSRNGITKKSHKKRAKNIIKSHIKEIISFGNKATKQEIFDMSTMKDLKLQTPIAYPFELKTLINKKLCLSVNSLGRIVEINEQCTICAANETCNTESLTFESIELIRSNDDIFLNVLKKNPEIVKACKDFVQLQMSETENIYDVTDHTVNIMLMFRKYRPELLFIVLNILSCLKKNRLFFRTYSNIMTDLSEYNSDIRFKLHFTESNSAKNVIDGIALTFTQLPVHLCYNTCLNIYRCHNGRLSAYVHRNNRKIILRVKLKSQVIKSDSIIDCKDTLKKKLCDLVNSLYLK